MHRHARGNPLASALVPVPVLWLVPLLALATACLDPGDPDATIGRGQYGAVVSDFESSSCSTQVVLELSLQIADEITCLAPDEFVAFGEQAGIEFSGSAVIPYLTPGALADLEAALTAFGGTVRINSGFRTVAQQYLLRRWFELGRCGITAAAQPGRSNHESGRALDIGNFGEWSSILPMFDWEQTVPGDPVHFDHVTSPDLRGLDVLAFQRLWNRNHPEDEILEDGIYGPMTEARLRQSPAEGFPVGACSAFDGALVSVTGPDALAPGATAEVTIEVDNIGGATWLADQVQLVTAEPLGRDSALADTSWIDPAHPVALADDTEPDQRGRFAFTIRAPEVEDDTALAEVFSLADGAGAPFGPAITIELDVLPGGPGSGNDGFDDPGDETGGCSAGGPVRGGGLAVWLAVALLACWPRRRRASRRRR